ncbi:MAG: hypothetical protein QOH15_1217 [Gaiellales bacterium]|nr:hypothetical protein [Gaiellales bacterium]
MPAVANESCIPRHTNDDPEHDAGYPPYVITLEQKRRWDTCEGSLLRLSSATSTQGQSETAEPKRLSV